MLDVAGTVDRRGEELVTRILKTAACFTQRLNSRNTGTCGETGTCGAGVTVVSSEAIFNANKRAVHKLGRFRKTTYGPYGEGLPGGPCYFPFLPYVPLFPQLFLICSL